MPVIDVGDARLFYTDSGGNGVPLLLVHGWTCDSHDWVFQLDSFEQRHRVIAVDLRGHGRSSGAEGGDAEHDYSAQRYAGDLAVLVDQLDAGPVVAVGHSLGASVAAALALEHPHLVLAMVAVEPAYGQDPATVEWMRRAAEQFGDDAGNALAAQLQGATEPLAPAWLQTWHRRRTLGMAPGLLARTFHDMYFAASQISGQPATDAYLARRTCPTLAFHRLPAMAAWERSTLHHPASRVVSWEGAGHWLHQERPAEFNALVVEWVAGLAAAADPDPVAAAVPEPV